MGLTRLFTLLCTVGHNTNGSIRISKTVSLVETAFTPAMVFCLHNERWSLLCKLRMVRGGLYWCEELRAIMLFLGRLKSWNYLMLVWYCLVVYWHIITLRVLYSLQNFKVCNHSLNIRALHLLVAMQTMNETLALGLQTQAEGT